MTRLFFSTLWYVFKYSQYARERERGGEEGGEEEEEEGNNSVDTRTLYDLPRGLEPNYTDSYFLSLSLMRLVICALLLLILTKRVLLLYSLRSSKFQPSARVESVGFLYVLNNSSGIVACLWLKFLDYKL